MEDSVSKYQRVIRENNLQVQFAKPVIRPLEDGAVLIERPQLLISDVSPVVVPPVESPTEPVKEENEPTTGQVVETPPTE